MNVATARRGRRPGQSEKVTVKDVAAAAGVSMMTVSNVMHNRANVGAVIRDRVQEKIKELGYVPSRAAQELAGKARPHFGLLYPGVINPFIAAVIVGVMEASSRLRVDVSVQLAQLDHPKAFRNTIGKMKERAVDGLILPSPIAEFAASTFRKTPLDLPAVAIAPGFALPGMASVRSDERQASFDLVSMLLDLGHTRIGHLSGPERQSGSIARLQGYRDAMTARGLDPRPEHVVQSAFRFQDGLKAAEMLLDRKPQVTAIFAANDTLGASVLAAAQRRGLPVPKALSVVGYDDSPIAEQVWPGLTTVHQDARLIAEKAVTILEQGVRTWRADRSYRLSQDVILPYEIIQRSSVAPVPQRAAARSRVASRA